MLLSAVFPDESSAPGSPAASSLPLPIDDGGSAVTDASDSTHPLSMSRPPRRGNARALSRASGGGGGDGGDDSLEEKSERVTPSAAVAGDGGNGSDGGVSSGGWGAGIGGGGGGSWGLRRAVHWGRGWRAPGTAGSGAAGRDDGAGTERGGRGEEVGLTTNLGTVAWAAPEMLSGGGSRRAEYTAKVNGRTVTPDAGGSWSDELFGGGGVFERLCFLLFLLCGALVLDAIVRRS